MPVSPAIVYEMHLIIIKIINQNSGLYFVGAMAGMTDKQLN
jgi:hypothetical protein